MKLTLLRYSSGDESTEGLLYVNEYFLCFTLEDEKRNLKKYGETRIPAGLYEIKFRKEGGTHERYLKRFPKEHKGMLHIIDVPGFEYILIHIGNTDDDTDGCVLVGDQIRTNLGQEGLLSLSTQAYLKLYPIVANALESGEAVFIRIKDRIDL